MSKIVLNRCQKIAVTPIENNKFYLYCPPEDLCAQYNNESLEWLLNKYNITQNRQFIIYFYMYKVASIVFGEDLTYDLKKGRRFKTEYFDWQLENIYKSNGLNPLLPIKFESINFDKTLEIKPSNLLEQTFRELIKNNLKDDNLYFDNDSYIDFKCNFLNGLVNFTWGNKKTNGEVKQWAKQELKGINSDHKRLLRYDCEKYFLTINGIAHYKIYKAIRKYISKEEKRLFILAWFMNYRALGVKSPYLPFGVRIPSFHRIFLDFYLGMPNSIKKDLLNLVLFKKPKTELNELWNKYLKVYPIWLLIIRDNDRITKQMQRERLDSLQKIKAIDKYGKEQTLEEITGQKDYALLRRLTEIDILENPYLTDKEKGIIKLLWEGYLISEIAKEKKVSQPAISKMLKNIREKLRK